MKRFIIQLAIIATILVQAAFYPVSSFADSASPTPDETSEQAEQSQQTAAAPPEDKPKYTYNKETGLWESDKYTWDPATRETTAKSPTYTYDTSSGTWNSPAHTYNSTSGAYEPATSSQTSGTSSSHETSNAPGSKEKIATGADAAVRQDITSSATIDNTLVSGAASGNANVTRNTYGGHANSGHAHVDATMFNLLQSSFSPSGNVATFTADITEDRFGDLILDPSTLPRTAAITPGNAHPSVDITVRNDGSIHNTIDLSAVSGDAAVEGNTRAGDATSGDALAQLNLINVINSSIESGQSFVGTINIHANLDGDILLPPEIEQQLLAGNAPTTTLDASTIEDEAFVAELTNTSGIVNNTSLSAASGDATVADNTTAGSATSGRANTELTVLNLTGRQIIGNNALLVFVNVHGKWIGAIMDAPAGVRTATLTDRAAQVAALAAANGSVDAESNASITNDITVHAESGDAMVNHNNRAGSARSGDAAAEVNIANIANSTLSLGQWFGVLFINILGSGSWNGSFGVDTAAGETPVPSGPGTAEKPSPSPSAVRAFHVTQDEGGMHMRPVSTQLAAGTGSGPAQSPEMLPSTTPQEATAQNKAAANPAQQSEDKVNNTVSRVILAAVLGGLLLLALTVGKRLFTAAPESK